jgi:hypothetical protein
VALMAIEKPAGPNVYSRAEPDIDVVFTYLADTSSAAVHLTTSFFPCRYYHRRSDISRFATGAVQTCECRSYPRHVTLFQTSRRLFPSRIVSSSPNPRRRKTRRTSMHTAPSPVQRSPCYLAMATVFRFIRVSFDFSAANPFGTRALSVERHHANRRTIADCSAGSARARRPA